MNPDVTQKTIARAHWEPFGDSDRSFRIVGTMAHLWGCPSARFLR